MKDEWIGKPFRKNPGQKIESPTETARRIRTLFDNERK